MTASDNAPSVSYNILLADDNPMNLALAEKLLKRRGHVVTTATNGKEAWDALQSGSFDVILMDVEMPEMDGLEATRRIRESEQDDHIPIIALSAYDKSEEEAKCLEAGMDGFINKPIDIKTLVPTMIQIVEEVQKKNK